MFVLCFLVVLSHCFCLHGFLIDDGSSGLSRNISISTNVGVIVGSFREGYFDGHKFQVKEFLGIPYAEPPIGLNRFRKPVPKGPFTTPYYASKFGHSCLQQQVKDIKMSEDCLFLNVYVPDVVDSSSSKLAVMVWIHGGGFQHGSSQYYSSDVLSTFGGVIVVTLNYRLAHLGFLPDLEGMSNFGLWDQHFAIKWIHDNIAAFGGDTNRITIFGESAGSSSVIYQALYAENKGLFQRVIAESGSITSPWAFDTNETVYETFQVFSSAIGCDGSYDQITCLRNKTTDEVQSVIDHVALPYIHPNADNAFVPNIPSEMLIESLALNDSLHFFEGLDLMMGSNSIDGALFLQGFARDFNITDIDHLNISRSIYENLLIPEELAKVFKNVQYIPMSVKEVVKFEYTDWSDPDGFIARAKMLTNFMTDLGMIAPMVATSMLHSQGHKGQTYLYEFFMPLADHLIPVPTWLDGPLQANHGDELPYVFGFSEEMVHMIYRYRGGYNVTDQDIQRSKFVMNMWSNFAKSGNPNLPVSLKQYLSTTWSEFTESSQNYIEIMPEKTSSVKQRIRARQMRLWLELLPSFLKESVV